MFEYFVSFFRSMITTAKYNVMGNSEEWMVPYTA